MSAFKRCKCEKWTYFNEADEDTWPDYGLQVLLFDFDADKGYQKTLDHFRGAQWYGRRLAWAPLASTDPKPPS